MGKWVRQSQPNQCSTFRSSFPEAFCKKAVAENFANITGKHLCQSLEETAAQLLSCEFCKVFKNSFSDRTPPVADASAFLRLPSNL